MKLSPLNLRVYLGMDFRKCILIITALFAFTILPAQKTEEEDYISTQNKKAAKTKKDKEPFSERLVYGGNLGLWLGSVNYIQVNPMIGYKITDWWAAGPALNYTYFGNVARNINYYGGSAWTRVRPFPGFYLHTEIGALKANYYDKVIPVWLAGGGVVMNGDFASLSVFLMYDLMQNEYSPYYGTLVPSGGILIGF